MYLVGVVICIWWVWSYVFGGCGHGTMQKVGDVLSFLFSV